MVFQLSADLATSCDNHNDSHLRVNLCFLGVLGFSQTPVRNVYKQGGLIVDLILLAR
jgi:hypothetical protein